MNMKDENFNIELVPGIEVLDKNQLSCLMGGGENETAGFPNDPLFEDQYAHK